MLRQSIHLLLTEDVDDGMNFASLSLQPLKESSRCIVDNVDDRVTSDFTFICLFFTIAIVQIWKWEIQFTVTCSTEVSQDVHSLFSQHPCVCETTKRTRFTKNEIKTVWNSSELVGCCCNGNFFGWAMNPFLPFTITPWSPNRIASRQKREE